MKLTRTAALALLAPLAGCHVSHTDVITTGPPPPLGPAVVVPEVEVNDHAWAPQWLGWVAPGDHLIIEGSSTDGGWDPRDGFAMLATEPMIVDVSLFAHVPFADLDWCVWDPTVGDYTVCAETALDPEVGSFVVVPPGNEFHVVVSSWSGTSTYSLELTFHKYYGLEAGDGPGVRALDRAGEVPTAHGVERGLPAPRTDAERGYAEPEAEPLEFDAVLFELVGDALVPSATLRLGG